ncbi:serine dehydratase subunit alpha family protein [Carboxylicivirga sp. M1479]|uniref:L-cysteine desulfidase family protein n=1 Tax=Carboxylicivirga sp. M1479 TaxID=2594476 RepID=UPI0011775C38|nr:L-serine ammonia-lyase, iron-sulfur-dependent, subunit alpha [Carboxylicivirga sp. M1479]TRX66541.1 serine dehydratase subunit alpha family protein [Carboxylicivirga sp. M1479]
MDTNDIRYNAYIDILHEELIPAMGCTEPIAIAYAGAMARKILGCEPERVVVEASDNIIKNVKSVVVPNTGNLKGIEASAVAGIVAGDADKVLEVIARVDDEGKKAIADFLAAKEVKVINSESGIIFDLIVNVYNGEESASVQISHYHTNIVKVTKNDETTIHKQHCDDVGSSHKTDRSIMTVEDIIDFADSVDLSKVKDALQQQVKFNSAIANEGISNKWGANVGSVLLQSWGENDIKVRAKAFAAAGSDARMSGCELPVVIVSGSGNQGLATSVPVIEYAKELKADEDTMYRALLVSNLVTIHQKTGIGRLSAYCGAVSAGVGAGAGITYLYGGRYKEVAHTIVNALAIVSGIICDGAKPSCAGKIASSVEAGILGYHMYKNGQQFYGGDGIVVKGVENTIKNIGRLGSVGMRETDKEIIRIMLGE